MTATATCTTCDLGLEHCHGLLAEHPDGTATCLDGCGGPRAVHDDVAPCADLGLGCCEAPSVLDAPVPAPSPALAPALAPAFEPARAA